MQYFNILDSRVTTRHRGGDRPLRNEQEVAAALDSFISENDDLLSRAGSIEDLSRWVAGEIGEGKRKKNGI
jgi:hypothetical protein